MAKEAKSVKTETLHIRVAPRLKQQAEKLLDEMGLTTADAVNLFLKQVVINRSIPFIIRANVPNAETLAAMQEVDDMITGKLPKKSQSVDDFVKEMSM